MPTVMKSNMTATFMKTITAFTRALSCAPRTRTAVKIRTISTAGRFMSDPSTP